MRNSKYFEVFLSYENPTDFEVYKKKCENMTKPKNLSTVVNMVGDVYCNFSSGLNGFSVLMQDYVTKTTLVIKKIK